MIMVWIKKHNFYFQYKVSSFLTTYTPSPFRKRYLGAVDGEPRAMVGPDHAGLRGITGVVKGTNKIVVTGWTG